MLAETFEPDFGSYKALAGAVVPCGRGTNEGAEGRRAPALFIPSLVCDELANAESAYGQGS